MSRLGSLSNIDYESILHKQQEEEEEQEQSLLSNYDDIAEDFVLNPSKKPFQSSRQSSFTRNITESLSNKKKLILYMIGYIISGVAAWTTFKLELNSMINYPTIVSFINITGVTIMFGIPVIKDYTCGEVSEEVRDFPKWKFVFIAIMTVLGNTAQISSSNFMGRDSGPLTMLISQVVIPLSLLLSFLFLKKRYNIWQIWGALLIIGGTLVSMTDNIQHILRGKIPVFVWAAVINTCCYIPLTFANISREYIFRSLRQLPIMHMGWWQGAWEVPISMIAIFPYFLIVGDKTDEIPNHLKQGFMCVVGYNSLPGDSCERTWMHIIVFLIFTMFWQFTTVGILKEGSANLSYFLSALLIPLSSYFFSMKVFFGNDSLQIFSMYFFIGAGMVVLGMVVYGFAAKVAEKCCPKKQRKIPELQGLQD